MNKILQPRRLSDGLKFFHLQIASQHIFPVDKPGQFVADGGISDKSDHPLPMGIRGWIVGPLHEFQEVEQIGRLDLIFRGGLVGVNGAICQRRIGTPAAARRGMRAAVRDARGRAIRNCIAEPYNERFVIAALDGLHFYTVRTGLPI